ncbi:MAG TPA: 2,3,4,5-tetrahydropyridine-2,6-dicarboxylate N-succinyltransferase, partial [Candidatus Fonsibacter ubiquis]|nr:2,3,4,5-tetrahydropyridine-2,6-dicarboxylate N-succinyltransferase [Candidatus Fonsibacter ubiquis]
MSFENIILQAWEDRNSINKNSDKKIISAINETLENLDSGTIRVCEKKNNEWHTHQWIKKAILLSFKIQDNKVLSGPYAAWFDKIEGKTTLWDEKKHLKAGFRAVPNGVIRKSAYVGKNVVLMPSFINVGAYVDDGTMI